MGASNLTIFSVFHKEYPKPNCDFIAPIQVGKALTSTDLGFFKDDDGENISAKNPTFCELTALYWIWKNIDKIDSKFIGLSHYRRYFCFPQTIKKKKLFIHVNRKDRRDVYPKPFSIDELEQISSTKLKDSFLAHLNNNQLIIAKPTAMGSRKLYDFNIKDNYIYHHIRDDWYVLEEAIKKISPAYADFADDYFSTAKQLHSFNMFIGSKAFLINYCEWLFPILAEIETTVKLSDYPYQRRAIGFMAERLFNLYIKKNEIATVEYPVVFFD